MLLLTGTKPFSTHLIGLIKKELRINTHNETMNKLSKPLLYTWLAVGLFSALSCSQSTELGLSLVEQEQSDIVFNDTTTLIMTTVEARPVVTSNRDILTVGSYDDPTWGSVKATTTMNFRLPSTGATFPNTTLDSLVLLLAYDTRGQYGDIRINKPTSVNQVWEIARLVEDLVEGTNYHSDATFATDPQLLASNITFRPNDTAKVTVDGQTVAPHLRIRLADPAAIDLANMLLAPQGTAADIYESNNKFKEWFKGLQIRPTSANPADGSMLQFRAQNELTKLSLYYTDNSTGTPEKKRFDFLTNEDAEVVTTFEHGHPVGLTDNLPTDTIVYVQGSDGLHTKIEFPYLRDLGDVVINRASLMIMVADTGTLAAPIPTQLVAKYTANNNELLVIDDVLTSLDRTKGYQLFGGVLQAANDGTLFYEMSLSEFMQDVVDGKTTESAVYITLPSALQSERVKLINEKGELSAKLLLTYTKY